MQVNVQKFLEESGVKEPFYPGKRLILPCAQTAEFKSHCVVLDWRVPGKIRLDVKAGITGKDLEPKKLKKYPLNLQMPTYVEIEVLNDNAAAKKDESDEDGEASGSASSSGKGGSGGKRPGLGLMAEAFGQSVEGKVPSLGKIVKMVVMGTEIAAAAFGDVFERMTKQISHAKISTTELLAQAGKMITKVMPPSFLEPKGDETVPYKYDVNKNADIGYKLTPG